MKSTALFALCLIHFSLTAQEKAQPDLFAAGTIPKAWVSYPAQPLFSLDPGRLLWEWKTSVSEPYNTRALFESKRTSQNSPPFFQSKTPQQVEGSAIFRSDNGKVEGKIKGTVDRNGKVSGEMSAEIKWQ